MATIIYLHGFASAGSSAKSEMLKREFAEHTVLAPDLSPNPDKAVSHVSQLIKDGYAKGETMFYLVGTSLGGFYASVLSTKFDIPAFLINPAMSPMVTLEKAVGLTHTNYSTGEQFEFPAEYLTKLDTMHKKTMHDISEADWYTVVAMDDDIIPAQPTIDLMKSHYLPVTVFATGGHRMNDFDKVVPYIKEHFMSVA